MCKRHRRLTELRQNLGSFTGYFWGAEAEDGARQEGKALGSTEFASAPGGTTVQRGTHAWGGRARAWVPAGMRSTALLAEPGKDPDAPHLDAAEPTGPTEPGRDLQGKESSDHLLPPTPTPPQPLTLSPFVPWVWGLGDFLFFFFFSVQLPRAKPIAVPALLGGRPTDVQHH